LNYPGPALSTGSTRRPVDHNHVPPEIAARQRPQISLACQVLSYSKCRDSVAVCALERQRKLAVPDLLRWPVGDSTGLAKKSAWRVGLKAVRLG